MRLFDRAPWPATIFGEPFVIGRDGGPRLRGFQHVAQDLDFQINRPTAYGLGARLLIVSDGRGVDLRDARAREVFEQLDRALLLQSNCVFGKVELTLLAHVSQQFLEWPFR